MSKIALDLKKFKHVKSDDHSTILKHVDGHELKVAHKSLSPEFQKQLMALCKPNDSKKESPKKLAEGGSVEDSHKYAHNPKSADPSKPPPSADYHDKSTPEQDKTRRAKNDADDAAFRKSQGTKPEADEDQGYTQYAEGGPIMEPIQDAPPPTQQAENMAMDKEIAAADKIGETAPNPYAEMYDKMYSQIKTLNPGEPDQFVRQQAMSIAEIQQDKDHADARNAVESQQMDHNKAVMENMRRQKLGLPPIEVPAQPDIAPPSPPSNVPVAEGLAQQAPASPVVANPSADPESMMQSGFANKMQGIDAQAKAQSDLGHQQAEMLNKNIEGQNLAKAAYKETFDNLDKERLDHMEDIKNGHIDPNNYWKDHSKVMTGIGMILAGFNPTNSPNAAVNFLKFQMEQNLNAQKENLGAKQNLLAANLRQFGNLKDATDMTRLMQHDIMANQLQSAAANAASPMAKAAAMQAAGQLKMETAPLFQSFAMRRAMMGLAGNGGSPEAIDHMLGYMRVMNPTMAKDMESRYVPHVGLASIPLTGEVRTKLEAHQKFDLALKDLQKFVNSHSTIVPGTPAYTTGQQKAMALQTMIRESMLNTVYREGEQPLLDKMLSTNPAGLLKNIKTNPQLKELDAMNQRDFNALRSSVGLPVNKVQEQSPVVKGKDGKMYRQVGNHMVPVK